MNSLSLEIADQMATACLNEGTARGYQPLTVVILDTGGHIIVAKRSDQSGILRIEIAFGKAWGALGMGLPSRALAKRAVDVPNFFQAISVASGGRLVPVPGGVLIRDDKGELLGAIGVSGDTSDNDETCAVHAVTQAGLTSDIEVR